MRRLEILNLLNNHPSYSNISKFDIFTNERKFTFDESSPGVVSVSTSDLSMDSISLDVSDFTPPCAATMLLKERLDQYIEFDSDEIFLCNDVVRIFGGAIRDCINGSDINDVDILCTSKSREVLNQLLIRHGYKHLTDIHKDSLNQLYKGISIISEPLTYINSRMKIIQLIFPVTPTTYENSFNDLITNVDISCCGISYNGLVVYENVRDAIIHAQYKKFIVLLNSRMFQPTRINARIFKFTSRGYTEINGVDYRTFKINLLLDGLILDKGVLNISGVVEYDDMVNYNNYTRPSITL